MSLRHVCHGISTHSPPALLFRRDSSPISRPLPLISLSHSYMVSPGTNSTRRMQQVGHLITYKVSKRLILSETTLLLMHSTPRSPTPVTLPAPGCWQVLEGPLGIPPCKGQVNCTSFPSTLGDSLPVTERMLLGPSLGFAICIGGKGESSG